MARPHRIIPILSRNSVELPLTDVIIDGQLELFPQVEEKALLFLQFRRGCLIVTAGKFIGLIPLTSEISIDVKPKLPVSNLSHVLELSRTSIKTLRDADRVYATTTSPGSSMLGFLLQNLIESLRPVRSQGLLKNYVPTSQVTSDLRGHMSISTSMQTCWSKGQKHRASINRFDQTADIAPNRLIQFALEYALTILGRSGSDIRLMKQANDIHHEFPREIDKFRPSDYAYCQSLVARQGLPTNRQYYYRPLEVALLILAKQSVSLDMLGEDIALQTFLLDFEETFEKYLRRVLELRVPIGTLIRDGNSDGKKALYDNRNDPPAQPDIVIQSPNGDVVIAEVKYKEKPDRADINQAVTYAVCYRTHKVVLVHQSKLSGPSGIYDIGIINGIRVAGYGFNLVSPVSIQ